MDPVITIVLVVAAAAAQVNAMACNLSHKNGIHHCYGALGEPLSIQLAADSRNEEITFKKDLTCILHFKTGEDWRPKLHQDYVHRSEIFNNGTFRLDSVIEEDSGDYQLEIHNSEGILLRKVNMLLEIQVFSSQIRFVILTVGIALAVGTLALLLAVFVGVNCLCGKLRFEHTTSGFSNDEGDAVVYTEVFNTRTREVHQNATEMVEYGEIKMAASLNEEESPKGDMEMTNTQT
ncbi:uncharacterized protein LOC116352813 [Oncorhynchus kisutch]|uniref:uncharacterized protein LOC116352813 n=1 Tax=Oncorhynchus kisutch TaxID=8019 RepID=UPI0009A08D7D|nr:uncharacterized protein LOC116352813 [Oncorhynchus kisutch]